MVSSTRFITIAARPIRSLSYVRQSQSSMSQLSNFSRPLASELTPSDSVHSIARRTVHVEQHRAKENDAKGSRKSKAPVSRNRSRRSRSKRISLDERKVPSYKEFVHRFTVLSLYRGFLKCIRDTMPHNQEDLKAQVRKEFHINKDDTNSFTVKQNIAEGQRRFEELKEFTGQSNKYTGESWINIQDPDDPRGRVGTGWPWAK